MPNYCSPSHVTSSTEDSGCNPFLPFASFFIHSYEGLPRSDHSVPRAKDVGLSFWSVNPWDSVSCTPVEFLPFFSKHVYRLTKGAQKKLHSWIFCHCGKNQGTLSVKDRSLTPGLQRHALHSIKSSCNRHTFAICLSLHPTNVLTDSRRHTLWQEQICWKYESPNE